MRSNARRIRRKATLLHLGPIQRLTIEITADVNQSTTALTRKPIIEPLNLLLSRRIEIIGEPNQHIGITMQLRTQRIASAGCETCFVEHLSKDTCAVDAL